MTEGDINQIRDEAMCMTVDELISSAVAFLVASDEVWMKYGPDSVPLEIRAFFSRVNELMDSQGF